MLSGNKPLVAEGRLRYPTSFTAASIDLRVLDVYHRQPGA